MDHPPVFFVPVLFFVKKKLWPVRIICLPVTMMALVCRKCIRPLLWHVYNKKMDFRLLFAGQGGNPLLKGLFVKRQ